MNVKKETAADVGASRSGTAKVVVERRRECLFSSPKTRISDALFCLASKADRLRPSHTSPEQFYIDREDLVEGLRRLARECGR